MKKKYGTCLKDDENGTGIVTSIEPQPGIDVPVVKVSLVNKVVR